MDLDLGATQYPDILSKINSTEPGLVYEAVVAIRKLLSLETNPPIDWVINSGLVQRLHYLLQFGELNVQFEASWALTNVASGTSAHTRYVVDSGVVHTFIILLNNPDEHLSEQCLWGIGNITGDSVALRDYVLSLNLTDSLITLLQRTPHKISFLRNLSWTISNMCRGSPPPNFQYIKPLFPSLGSFIKNTANQADDHVVDSLWAFAFITDNTSLYEDEIFEEFMKLGVLENIFRLLDFGHNEVVVPAFRVIGNLLSGKDHITQTLLNLNVLKYIEMFSKHPKESFVKDSYWCLSNITSGTTVQIQKVIDTGMIPKVLEVGLKGAPNVKTEIIWVILNAISGANRVQISYLLNINVIFYLCNIVPFLLTKSQIHSTFVENINILFNKTPTELRQLLAKEFFKNGWSRELFQGAHLEADVRDSLDIFMENLESVGEETTAPSLDPSDVSFGLSNLNLNK